MVTPLAQWLKRIMLKASLRFSLWIVTWFSRLPIALARKTRERGVHRTAVLLSRCCFIELLEPRLAMAVGDSFVAPADPRVIVDATGDWRFAFNPSGTPQSVSYNDSSWGLVDLPHTWNATDGQDGGTFYANGVGWYRNTFTAAELAALAGQKIFLEFEGASIITDLYVDGVAIDFNPVSTEDSHVGGFGTFRFDLTQQLTAGQSHLVAVRTQNNNFATITPPQAGDYSKYGGLYRDVRFVGVDPTHIALRELQTFAIDADGNAGTAPTATNTPIATPGIYFNSSNVSAASATVEVKTKLDNQLATARNVAVHSVLVNDAGVIVAEHENTQNLAPGASSIIVTQSSSVANPRFWNGRIDPYLYDLYVEVRDESTDELLDLMHERVGIRTFDVRAYDAQNPNANGFVLNGQDYDLHGVNYHQDTAGKGWAKSDADTLADLTLMADMGVTVIRTSHYQHSQYFYNLADEMGFVVYTETAVNGTGGNIPTTEPNMSAFFNNSADQLAELVLQNYNRPSVVFWGMHNEVSQGSGTQFAVNERFFIEMNRMAHALDPSRMTIAASTNNTVTNYDRLHDNITFNRYFGWYGGAPADLAAWADQSGVRNANFPVGLGEFGGGASIYHHTNDVTDLMSNPNGQQWHPENYQAWVHEQLWSIIADRPWMFAKTIWLMFDFGSDGRNEGAQPGINDKGIATLDRQTKDAYHYYQANWNDPNRSWNNEQVLYIADWRWTDRHSSPATVKVYSNLDAPQLTLNGVSQGTMIPLVTGGLLIPNTYTMQVTLADGDNEIAVNSLFNSENVADSVTWTYHAPTLAGSPFARIDFTSGPSNAQQGYDADSGLAYGVQSNGTYGWLNASTLAPATNFTGLIDAAAAAPFNELRYRTRMEFPSNRIWEYALPNGLYDVRVVSADSDFTNMINNMTLEGFQLQDDDSVLNAGNPGSSPDHDEFYARVDVTDGRLTLTTAPGAVNGRLAFLEINSVVEQPELQGDYNSDDVVDGEDLGVWQSNYGPGGSMADGDGDGDGDVDGRDFLIWQRNYGNAIEPAPLNNLVLIIHPETGIAHLKNETTQTLLLDAYSINSTAGSLLPQNGSWNSLADQSIQGWVEAFTSEGIISELNALGFMSIAPGNAISLGEIFDLNDPQVGITLEYTLSDGTEMQQGAVVFRAAVGTFSSLSDNELEQFQTSLVASTLSASETGPQSLDAAWSALDFYARGANRIESKPTEDEAYYLADISARRPGKYGTIQPETAPSRGVSIDEARLARLTPDGDCSARSFDKFYECLGAELEIVLDE
ncbi:MAG: glycoside hydrolase family 2 TIM barrel-domain containing protein [Bythopirellula sp.]|nr:glycoside hydrolase family 2 TIM barrel-domain containing protein [Bythopirellula sp.]